MWSFLKKLRIELPYDPSIPLLGICPKDLKTHIRKNICTPMFIAALFTVARKYKQAKCPTIDDWIKKLWYICTMEYYSALRRDEILPFATTWMDLEIIIYHKTLWLLPYPKRYSHTNVHSSIIHGGQDTEATEMSYDRWLNKGGVVHIYNGILLSPKKRWNTAICDNMVGPWDNHAKWNKQTEKVENHMISLISGT